MALIGFGITLMANGHTRPPPGHALLNVKQDQKHPPPTPPNVSVEAIKRSLVHTPSPRRFKKLRLRRLQERLRREEGTQQVPRALVDTNSEGPVGGKRDNHGDDGGDGVTGLQNDENDELDELDLAVLNIGLNDDDMQPGSPGVRDQSLSRNPETRLQTPNRDTLPPCQRLRDDDDDDAGSVAFKEVVKKKRGRKGKTRKRLPRRLPVHELVLGPERVQALGLLNDDGTQDDRAELSQDPISQPSSDDAAPRHRKPAVRKLAKANLRKQFGEIDISKFRFPAHVSWEDRYVRWLETRFDFDDTPSYADGFVGDEASPIGQPMPTSQRGRPPRRSYRKPPKCELTLIAHKDFGSEDQNMHVPQDIHHEQPQPEQKSFVQQDSGLAQSSYVLNDPFLDDGGTRNFSQDEEGDPNDLSVASDIGTPRTISSPLVRKQSHMRRVRFSENPGEQDNVAQTSKINIPPVETRGHGGYGNASETRSLLSPNPPSFSSNHAMRQRKAELDVRQELAMVSVHKRIDSSDSDESSDGGSGMDDEVHSETHFNAGEYEEYEPLDTMDSGDEGDVEMEDDTSTSQVGPPTQEANRDDIEDDSEASTCVHKDSQLSARYARDNNSQQDAMDMWRPRRPRITNNAMEVDDEIVSTPEVPRATSRAPDSKYGYGRRPSEGPSQALASTKLSTKMAYHSQVSIELGDTQKLISQSPEPTIPQTPIDDESIDAEQDDSTQYTFVPQEKYFSRASKQLEASTQGASLVRMNSLPSRLGSYEARDNLADGEIPESQTSNYTTQRREMNSRTLTRQSSFNLPTYSKGSPRTVPLPLNPPFNYRCGNCWKHVYDECTCSIYGRA